MLEKRFYKGTGRYGGLAASRYMGFTYGRDSFADPEIEVSNDEAHGSYGGLLFDKRWIERRREIILRDGGRCVICKVTDALQVHHRQYHIIKALKRFKAPWDYEDRLLVTLCERCHSRGHNKFRVPNVYL